MSNIPTGGATVYPNLEMMFHPANTAAPPDARWRRAITLASSRQVKTSDDVWVGRAVEYLLRLRAGEGATVRDDLADIEDAHEVYAADKPFTRGELEARLLADQSDVEVAAAMGLTTESVEVYHALFFDVRSRLKAPLWVLGHALGNKCFAGLTEADTAVILRRAAYLRGPHMLDALLRYYREGCAVPADLASLTREDLVGLCDRLATRTLIMAWTLPFERAGRVLLLRQLVRELDALIEDWTVDAGPPAALVAAWPVLRLAVAVAGAPAAGVAA